MPRRKDTPEVAAFRAELRAWLDANVDDEVRALAAGHAFGTRETLPARRAWQRRIDAAGFSAVAWPPEHGGRGAGPLEQAAYAEEMSAAGAPGTLNPIGMANIAPSIMHWGNAEQRAFYLPRMRNGDDVWCQGFSEPGAGSDLASLATKAVRDGDHYVVSGQKVWTSMAHIADWCELLVRTTPLDQAPKHKGLSVLIVDMHARGVTVRPLHTITGEHEFNEVFFDDVRVPVTALLGPENEGWRVAMTTLNNERAGVLTLAIGSRKKVEDLIDAARQRGNADDPVVRQVLARAWVAAEVLGLLGEESIAAAAAGVEPGAGASLGKLVWAASDAAACAAAEVVLGPDAAGGSWGRQRTYHPAMSIAGGTTAVNKGVVATQVLGLPRSR
jgi:alkylation response protein AidB-like acyl-CoA dehydrogenase